jgi:large subunit ribosomal protein L5
MVPILKKKYDEEVVPALQAKFGYKNKFAVPKLRKIVINMGIGDTRDNPSFLEKHMTELAAISGQRPIKCKAHKSIAGFKVKAGQIVGIMVTLRGNRMYDFLYRLINLAIPRIRDFRGLSPRSLDNNFNYTIGIKEQIIFPEVDYDKVERVRGMNITLVTTGKNREETLELLSLLGLPLAK